MKYSFRRNDHPIEVINRDFLSGKLIVDTTYQRRKVWNDQDKIRLIETILLELVIPEVFFWTASRNPDTGEAITHIVDGQQRINTIVDYINGEFILDKKYLLNDGVKNSCGDFLFKDLSSEYKQKIWEYPISIVEIDSDCSKDEIKQMFYRLNLTNYNLNPQEKRNSLDSEFGDKCDSLSTLDFWKEKRIFSSNDAKRMKDVEYCCSIYILANEGIVDQTNQRKINEYYDDYKDEFDKDNKIKNKVISAMDIIDELTDKTTISFVSKKAQMYTLFCMAMKMLDNNITVNETIFEKFKLFVEAYNKFRNEFVISYDDDDLSKLYENLKKYKLASSEGINKVGNRMIRFEILYKICIESKDVILELLKIISNDFSAKLDERNNKFDKLEEDDLVDVEDE